MEVSLKPAPKWCKNDDQRKQDASVEIREF